MIDFDKLQTYNTDVVHAFHGKIMECDIREASLQISERYNLLPKEVITYLRSLDKTPRVKATGEYQKQHPEFSEAYYKHLREIRIGFVELNKLKNEEILSIHSDAIIVNSKRKLKFIVDGVEFRPKHHWTSYIRYKNVEMLYDGDNDKIDYKGLGEKLFQKHERGICQHILKVFGMIENDDERIYKYLSSYQTKYLTGELPNNVYESFERLNGVRVIENLELLSFLCKIAIKEC